MKKTVVVLILLVVVSSGMLFSAESRQGLGVGLSLGIPFMFAATGEYDFGDVTANATIGYWDSGFAIRGGADFNLPEPLTYMGVTVYPRIGGNFSLIFQTFSVFVIGAPIGLAYYLDAIPMRIVLKVGPELMLAPVFGLSMVATVSGLYMF